MSRAYRIRVSESITRVHKADDHASFRLELLEILPSDGMCAILKKALIEEGFEELPSGELKQTLEGGLSIEVDPQTGEVKVRNELEEEVHLERTKETRVYEEAGRKQTETKRALEAQLRKELESSLDQQAGQLQKQATAELESHIPDVQQRLNQILNKVTAEALKTESGTVGGNQTDHRRSAKWFHDNRSGCVRANRPFNPLGLGIERIEESHDLFAS